MRETPDDPVIRCMERTGYPPRTRYRYWAFSDWEDDEEHEYEEEPEEE